MEILSNNNVSEQIEKSEDAHAHFMIRDRDTGKIFDLRNPSDYKKVNTDLEKLSNYNLNQEDKKFYVECYKLNQKIRTKFFKYCERGEISKIKQLLDTRRSPDLIAPINEKYMHGFTVLHVAVSNSKYTWFTIDNMDVVDILLDHCTDLEAVTSLKRSPFHIAVLKNFLNIVKLLVSCGCNIQAKDSDGNTSLHYACRVGKLLLYHA